MPKQNQNRPKRRFFCEKHNSFNNVRLVQRRSRVHVAHFSFKIALSGAIMLTLLLVCSFSPRVHSIPRGPRILLRRITLPKQQKTRQNMSGFCGGGRGIRSCLLQSNLGQQFLCFAKAFGQPLKTTHRVVFLTLSFKSPLLSVEKQKRTSKHLSVISIGETGICEIA